MTTSESQNFPFAESNAVKVFFYLSIIAYIILLYHQVLATYAYTDSYEFLLNAGNTSFIDVFIQSGRLFYGMANKVLFTTFNTIEQASYIRSISLVGGILFSLILFHTLVRFRFSPWLSLLVVIVFVSTPAFGIIMLWSATYQVSWGLAIALMAGNLVVFSRRRWYLYLVSVIMGLVALNLYQSAYTIFIIPIFLRWLKDKELRVLVLPLVVHVATYLVYFILYKVSLSYFDIVPAQRASLSYDILTGIDWFINGSFDKALNYNQLFARKFWLNLTRVLVLISILFCLIDVKNFVTTKKEHLLSLVVLLALLLLSMLPNIISTDTWVSYRTMNSLLLIIILHIVWGFSQKIRMKKNYRIAGWLLLLFYSFFSAYFNVHDGFININKREYESVKKALTVQVDPTTATVYYIPPPMKLLVDNDLIERVITDEYGRLSNSSPWAPKPMIQLILGREREIAIKVYQGEPLHANEALIDMGKVYLDYVSNDH